jgi:hypothetical protein
MPEERDPTAVIPAQDVKISDTFIRISGQGFRSFFATFRSIRPQAFDGRALVRAAYNAACDIHLERCRIASDPLNPSRPGVPGEPRSRVPARSAANARPVGPFDAFRINQDEMANAEAAQEFGEQGADTPQADDGDFGAREDRLSGVPEQTDLTVKVAIDAPGERPGRWSDTAQSPTDDGAIGKLNARAVGQPDIPATARSAKTSAPTGIPRATSRRAG